MMYMVYKATKEYHGRFRPLYRLYLRVCAAFYILRGLSVVYGMALCGPFTVAKSCPPHRLVDITVLSDTESSYTLGYDYDGSKEEIARLQRWLRFARDNATYPDVSTQLEQLCDNWNNKMEPDEE